MRILLVQPDWCQERFGFRMAAMPEPLGLETLAGWLGDHDVRILDMRCGGQLEPAIREFDPELVGVTALTTEVYAAREVVKTVKRLSPKAFTVVGGHHASLLPHDFHIPEVDAIIIGEGEPIMAELVARLAAGRDLSDLPNVIYRDRDGSFRVNPTVDLEIDFDTAPFPRRDLTAAYRDQYFFLFDRPDTSMATGRGCPYRCNFCSVWEFYRGKVRMMSPRRVLDELKTVTTDHVTFVDDNFLLDWRRETKIADMIRSEGIKRRYSMECRTNSIVSRPALLEQWVDIGLYAVLLGLEGTGDTLETVNKKNTVETNDQAIRILQDHGVVIWGAFIVHPEWDVDDFQRLRDYVQSRGITHTQYTVLTPLPGTELHRQNRHRLITDDYTCFDTLHAVVPTKLPREEFYRQFAQLYQQVDLTPYWDLIRNGKLTFENMKQGKAMLDAMSKWESCAANDPVLREGNRQPIHLPGQASHSTASSR